MRKEDEIYVELHILRLVSLCAEINYTTDKFGNIVFKDKNKVIENINKVISDSTKLLEASEDEVRDYLIQIYKNKIELPEFTKEGTEILSILEELKPDKGKTDIKLIMNKIKKK